MRGAPSEHELSLAEEDEPLLDDVEQSLMNDPYESDEDILPLPRRRFSPSRWQAKSPRQVIILIALLKFALVASGMLILVPMARLIEDVFCHAYYEDSSPDIIEEMKCKVDEVQSRMAYLTGWSGLLHSIIGLMVTFPYGVMADKVGRKPTVILAFVGLVMSFTIGPFMLHEMKHRVRENPYLLIIGAVFQLIGGGAGVMLSTTYAMASDVSTEKDKASNFLYLTFGATAGGLTGPVVAGLLMERFGPWVPIYIVMFMLPCIFCGLLLLPETLAISIEKKRDLGDEPAIDSIRGYMKHGVDELRQSLKMLEDPSVPLILVSFFIQSARYAAYTSTITQYLSKHFGWRLAEVSILLSPIGILHLVILAVMPKISALLMSPRFRMTPVGSDLFLTKISTAILVVGAFVQGISHNITLFLLGTFITTFGSADSPLARSTVTRYVSPEYVSRLYALANMIGVIGSFIGGPVLAWCFDQGMKKKGIWLGMPWFYVSFLCTLAGVALLFVKPPKKVHREDELVDDFEDAEDLMPDDPLRLR